MSATDKLDYLEETKTLIRNAINEKGVEVTENDTFRSYADKIVSIRTSEGFAIGFIGMAPFGINEEENTKRYLNGQVISQVQFETFTAKLKDAVALNPVLATTEENWQAEVTNSVNGTCSKFVIDDEAGTIRLPKYPEYVSKEYVEAAVVGNGMTLGLTNGTIEAGLYAAPIGGVNDRMNSLWASVGAEGTQVSRNPTGNAISSYRGNIGITTDPTKSGIVANLANATTETIPCKWFIQVANEVETSVDVTRQIQLNNPFTLLDYKWSEYELNNASWLISNGAFHSADVYYSVYVLLWNIKNGDKVKSGVSVKTVGEDYGDYDFVVDGVNRTFRLPIKVKLASGNAVVGNGMTLGMTDGTNNAGLNQYTGSSALEACIGNYGTSVSSSGTATNSIGTGSRLGITTDPTKSGIETSSSGLYLYFYVGETIQDANVIAASQVLSSIPRLQNEINDIGSKGLGYPTQEVIAQTWGTWVAPDNGFACANSKNTGDDHAYCFIYNTTTNMGSYGGAWNGGSIKYCSIAVSKGDVVTCGGNKLSGATTFFVRGK